MEQKYCCVARLRYQRNSFVGIFPNNKNFGIDFDVLVVYNLVYKVRQSIVLLSFRWRAV